VRPRGDRDVRVPEQRQNGAVSRPRSTPTRAGISPPPATKLSGASPETGTATARPTSCASARRGAYVFLSNGNGTFTKSYGRQPPAGTSANTTSDYPAMAGDWNGVWEDRLRAPSGGTGVYVFLSNGNGTFTPSFDPQPRLGPSPPVSSELPPWWAATGTATAKTDFGAPRRHRPSSCS